jgi:hypothetical protein
MREVIKRREVILNIIYYIKIYLIYTTLEI